MGYFLTFSSLEINPIIRNYLTIVPVQLLALAYVVYYWRFKPKQKDI